MLLNGASRLALLYASTDPSVRPSIELMSLDAFPEEFRRALKHGAPWSDVTSMRIRDNKILA